MIQAAALPIFVPGSAMSETPAQNPAENPGATSGAALFAGILAMQPTLTVPESGTGAVDTVTPVPATAPTAPATALPLTGKTLPPQLPPQLPPVPPKPIPAPDQAAADQAPTETPPPTARPDAIVHVRPAPRKVLASEETPAKVAKAQPSQVEGDVAVETPTVGEAPPSPILVLSPAAPVALEAGPKAVDKPTMSAQPAVQPRTIPAPPVAAGQATNPQILPPMVKAEVLPFVPMPADASAPVIEAQAGAPERAKSVASALLTLSDAPQAIVGTVTQLRVSGGLSQTGEKHLAVLPAPAPEPGNAALPPLASAPLAMNDGAGVPVQTRAEPAHDFSVLVDRLVAAREAAMPHPVHASLAHAEFGQVQLTFAHDAAGLTVAMASSDPDFARAVTAATPAERQSNSSDSQASSQGSVGSAPQNQPHNQPQSGARQGGSDGGQSRFPVRSSLSSEASNQPAAPAPRRTGIFA
ncbi:MAG: hypothetical protein ABI673_06350 [Novosphingobium sp.]